MLTCRPPEVTPVDDNAVKGDDDYVDDGRTYPQGDFDFEEMSR